MQAQSLFIDFDGGKLHLKRIYENPNGKPFFLLHGSIEDGKIFYSKSLKGFAPYLAQQGYDVFVLDMQGRGESLPKINRKSKYGQVDVIHTDIPLALAKIKEIKGEQKIVAASHSWGGVLLLSYLSRYDNPFKKLVFFGTKRRITVRSLEWVYKLLFGWYFLGTIFSWIYGYFPAVKMGIGSDNEPRNHFKQINKWLSPNSKWIDNIDGFDYGKSLQNKALPPLLFLAGQKDTLLGHPKDVQLLMSEVGNASKDYWLLAKKEGFLHDYGHIDMLTHKDAPKDFFGKVVDWVER